MEDQFFPSISEFMDADPKKFVSALNKMFLSIYNLNFTNALAAYQTINTVLQLRGDSLDSGSITVLTELKDKTIFAHLVTFIYECGSGSETKLTVDAIELVTGKKVPLSHSDKCSQKFREQVLFNQ